MAMYRHFLNALERVRLKRGKIIPPIDPVQLEVEILQLRAEIAELEIAEGRTDEDRAADPLTQEIIQLEKEIAELQAG